MPRNKSAFTRRTFLAGATGAAAATGILVVPRHFLGDVQSDIKPSNRVNTALIGMGIRGKQQTAWCMKDIHCDVDKKSGAKYQDYRKMLDEKDKDIDAVLIATPDHSHAIIAMEAMRRGKHVYCEKPLAHSIGEIRALGKMAKEKKLVTQLGNQGHSYDTCPMLVEWIRDGAIGNIKEVHGAHPGGGKDLSKLRAKEQVPDGMDWDLWIGPAKFYDFNTTFHPHGWRSWTPFGTGMAGDFLCHIIDPAFWALELDYPTSVIVENTGKYDPKNDWEIFSEGKTAKFEFAAKGKRGPITLYWYDGNAKAKKPEGVPEGMRAWGDGGTIIGDKGAITHGVWGAGGMSVYPEARRKEYMANSATGKGPTPTLKRTKEHHDDFANSIRAGKPASTDFSDFGGPLTELALLAIIGMRFPGVKLEWDGASAKFTNNDEANKHVDPPYRDGWKL